MTSTTLLGTVSMALGMMLPFAAGAQSALSGSETTAKSEETVAFVATPVDPEKLASYRGGAEVVRNDMTLNGTTANNSARNVETGDNSISAGSFANMSGLPVVIQNSGANVLIQNAVIVNVEMK